jgi:hypothetical protein
MYLNQRGGFYLIAGLSALLVAAGLIFILKDYALFPGSEKMQKNKPLKSEAPAIISSRLLSRLPITHMDIITPSLSLTRSKLLPTESMFLHWKLPKTKAVIAVIQSKKQLQAKL